MSITFSQAQPAWSFRLLLVCLAGFAISLPMAWVSLAKVLMFVGGLAYLAANLLKGRNDPALAGLWTPRVVLAMLLAQALSLFWTEVDSGFALLAFVKHAKLLEILLLISLIRTRREARIGLTAFMAGHAFVLASSWLLAAGVPIPWVSSPAAPPVVFAESYLDQAIMFATAAAVCWHLSAGEGFWPRWLAGLLAVAALLNVFFLLEGRTGHIVAVAMLSLSAMWAMPARWRLATLILAPAVLLLGLYFGSAKVQQRFSEVVQEGQTYASQGQHVGSLGWRMNAWHRSLQAMQARPLAGYGVGSWTPAVKPFEGKTATEMFGPGNSSNPHQEFLLWGVELGVGGVVLLLALLTALVRDARLFATPVSRTTLAVAAAMAIACALNSALYDDLMGDFFCILLGLLLALGLRSRQDHVEQATPVPLSPRFMP